MHERRGLSDGATAASPGVSITALGYVGVGELARAAETDIANERFLEGFKLLTLAQERASSDSDHLEQDDAITLGNALVVAGHALFNYYIWSDGQDLSHDYGPASDGEGRIKFQQAAEIFKDATENDPYDARAYLGLSAMQWELGQDSTHTITQLESMLEEQPDKDNVEVRLEMAHHYRQLEDKESAIKSYALAIGHSVDEHHLRHNVTYDLAKYLKECGDIEDTVLQGILSACMRAVIQDPDDSNYRALLLHLNRVKATSELATA